MDGVYYLDKVTTKIGSNGASQQSFESHKIGFRMDDAKVLIDEEPETSAGGDGGEYTVVRGDTLWKIAGKTLGIQAKYAEIYELNKDVIEEKAKARGKKDSGHGHWLTPGTVLRIPASD